MSVARNARVLIEHRSVSCEQVRHTETRRVVYSNYVAEVN